MADVVGDGDQRLSDLFEKLRNIRSRPSDRYETDDVVAVLCLLARGFNASEIQRRTYIGRETITKWRNVFLDGNIEALYPDIRERMATFNLDLLPPERKQRLRPMLAWQNSQMRLEDRPNPYAKKVNGG